VKSADLSHRVQQFRSASLPRQPPRVHKGTLFLIEDLVLEVERLEQDVERLTQEVSVLRKRLRGRGDT
jgi:hypothetical protein